MVAATSRPIDLLRSRERLAWLPRERPPVPDWVCREIRIPAETSATPGRYDPDRYPYWIDPLAAADDPEVETIAIVAATQLGKTTYLQALLAAFAVLDPAPAMLAAPDRDACRELRDKFYRLCDATPELARIIPPTWKRNDQWIDFGAMLCHLAWSGNTQRLSGKSCKRVLCTEVDRWKQRPHEGQTQKLIAERVKNWFHYLIVYESTPTDETSPIWELWLQSDMRRFLVPCPHCGLYQELRFFTHKEGDNAGLGGIAGMQGPAGEWLSPEQAEESAYYLCEGGCRIESADKAEMVRAGVWCPAGCAVETKTGRLKGKPDRSGKHRGYQLNSLYAETITFGRMAAEYLRSRDSEPALKSFWNNWLALQWTDRRGAPKWQRIGRRLAGGHRRGTVPQHAYFLTAGADVMDTYCRWNVRAWGEGSTSWLVDWGHCGQRLDGNGQPITSSDLNQLDELVLDRVFPLVGPNPIGQTQLRVRLMGIDYQGHRSWETFSWVRGRLAKGSTRIRIFAGDERVPAGELYHMSVVETHAGTGKKYPGGLQRWAVDVGAYKTELMQRFSAPLDSPGAWFLYDRILDDGQDYLRQICNEVHKVTRTRNGSRKRMWVQVDEKVGNHYWDCEVYAMAAGDMVVGRDWIDLSRQARPPQQRTNGGRSRSPQEGPRQQPLPYGERR